MVIFVKSVFGKLNINNDDVPFIGKEIRKKISIDFGIPSEHLLLYCNERIIKDNDFVESGNVIQTLLQLPGGKGGFGSMLRAIGAQIEKTTNKEACRDLSGRRLRDINEEKRLKKWIAKQSERELEEVERKKLKLERLKSKPKHEFRDSAYDEHRSSLVENINDALSQGLQKEKEKCGLKRTATVTSAKISKKPRIWTGMDEELEDCEEFSDNEIPGTSQFIKKTNTRSETEQSADVEQDRLSEKSHDDSNDSDLNNVKQDTSVKTDVKKLDSQNSEDNVTKLNQEETPVDHNTTLPSEANALDKNSEVSEELDLEKFNSVEELEKIGLEKLKLALIVLGLKCGGTLKQRAERLFSIKGLKKEDINPSLLAKPSKSKK